MDKLEAVWQALRERCCADPANAKRIVMIGRDDLSAALSAIPDERAAIVAWLRKDNGQCDCYARAATECACGAWDDYKTRSLLDIASDIERGDHLKEG